MKTLEDVFNELDKINDPNCAQYDYMKACSNESLPVYEKMLEEVLKDKPARIIDVGSCLNVFGFLFANAGIKYIGVDICKDWNPIETNDIEFIHADFNEVKGQFEEDIIISNLCVGYMVSENIKCKRLILGQRLRKKCKPETEVRAFALVRGGK
jgi:hypothetical protein